ncbi:MAG: hypothetical protein ISEC1_P0003 [Thiomicrorhabdus sp.]|nr:MAG: hypothetical protein ISEC1_P0003 [Thiomicrorhabdus sp.]
MNNAKIKASVFTTVLYSLILGVGYWLFSIELQTRDHSNTPLKEVAVTLSMFQMSPPAQKPIEPVKEKSVKPFKKPQPIEPIKPKPVPKIKPITIPIIEPIAQVEPIIEPDVEVIPELVKEPIQEPTQVAVEQPAFKALPIAQKPQFSQQQIATAEQIYLSALRDQIALHASNTYPNRAKRRHWEGTVKLEFTLHANGQIKGLAIVKSSGRQILDNAATTILQSKMNSQFLPFPKEINRQTWHITLPVDYFLT